MDIVFFYHKGTMIMDSYILYAIFLASLAISLITYTKYHKHLYALALRYGYYLKLPWISLTVTEVLAITTLMLENAILTLFLPRLTDESQAIVSIKLSLVHFLPVFLGAGTPFFHSVLPDTFHMIHTWLGISAVAQTLFHGVSFASVAKREQIISGSLAVFCFFASLVTGMKLWPSMRYISKKLHGFLAVAAMGFMLWHTWEVSRSFSSTAWIAVFLCGFSLFLSQAIKIRPFRRSASITSVEVREHMVYMTVAIGKKEEAGPSYIFLKSRDLPLRQRYRSEPILISWWEKSRLETNEFGLLLPKWMFHSEKLAFQAQRTRREPIRAFIRGPYRDTHNLSCYETVLLTAQGIGIAGVLPLILSLLERKHSDTRNKRTGSLTMLNNDKLRKLDLYWRLDSEHQYDSAVGLLDRLSGAQSESSRLQVWIAYDAHRNINIPSRTGWSRLEEQSYLEETSSAIKRQSQSTPGKSIVIGM